MAKGKIHCTANINFKLFLAENIQNYIEIPRATFKCFMNNKGINIWTHTGSTRLTTSAHSGWTHANTIDANGAFETG